MSLALKDEKIIGPEGQTELQDDLQQLFDSTIMMVDDEPITMEVVQAFLEEAGYRKFVQIEESTQAINAIEETCPDILLCEIHNF